MKGRHDDNMIRLGASQEELAKRKARKEMQRKKGAVAREKANKEENQRRKRQAFSIISGILECARWEWVFFKLTPGEEKFIKSLKKGILSIYKKVKASEDLTQTIKLVQRCQKIRKKMDDLSLKVWEGSTNSFGHVNFSTCDEDEDDEPWKKPVPGWKKRDRAAIRDERAATRDKKKRRIRAKIHR